MNKSVYQHVTFCKHIIEIVLGFRTDVYAFDPCFVNSSVTKFTYLCLIVINEIIFKKKNEYQC